MTYELKKRLRYFKRLYRVYRQQGGDKKRSEFENPNWLEFGAIPFVNFAIRQLIVSYPTTHPWHTEWKELCALERQLNTQLDSETEVNREKVVELDRLHDQLYEVEEKLVRYNEKRMNQAVVSRLEHKIHRMVQHEKDSCKLEQLD